MRSDALLLLACLGVWLPATGQAQSLTEGRPNRLALISFPGLKTDRIHLVGVVAQSFKLPIQYAEQIDRESFAAFLNGKDITTLFKPRATSREDVRLPLINGQNELILSVCAKGQQPAGCETQSLLLTKRVVEPSIGFEVAKPLSRQE